MAKRNPDTDSASRALCPKCMQPLIDGRHFCDHCGMPVTVQATTNPFERILAQGFAFREAANHPSKPIVVIGMWLVLAPSLIGIFATCIVHALHLPQALGAADGSADVVAALATTVLLGFLAVVLGTLLYKTTRNYFRLKGNS